MKEKKKPNNRLKADAKTQKQNAAEKLRESLLNGKLTLFCGAGVSAEAGIPTWDQLLLRLLEPMLEKIAYKNNLQLDSGAAIEFQKRNRMSSLILGKYLKNNLGEDFIKEIQKALYSSNVQDRTLLDAIVNLSRPQRDGNPLDSIVTFNYDCLIEESLNDASIPNKAIYSEEIGYDLNELPIYHVHGYLPRNSPIPAGSELIFSEDAYHSHFIDPFSWANLIQLNKLTQNVCFFIGVSLTDPNMRRLLDVAWRKNPDKKIQHYIIKKVKRSTEGGDQLDAVSRLLREQDANALGLNVIWINHYNELPELISNIAGKSSFLT